jgi:hypothetical protein
VIVCFQPMKVVNPASGESYPKDLDTPGKRALFDNLGKDLALAHAVDQAVRSSRQDDWRNNPFKIRRVMFAIKAALNNDDQLTAKTLELVKNQNEYCRSIRLAVPFQWGSDVWLRDRFFTQAAGLVPERLLQPHDCRPPVRPYTAISWLKRQETIRPSPTREGLFIPAKH